MPIARGRRAATGRQDGSYIRGSIPHARPNPCSEALAAYPRARLRRAGTFCSRRRLGNSGQGRRWRVGAVVSDCRIILGDCAQVLPSMEADSIDAIVTDPPAGIAFMGKSWDKDRGGRDSWIAWMSGVAAECLRVAKPGAHALVWAIPRTSHWTATAWENAGWEVRDRIGHLFGTGFPKSLDIGRAIDKAAGATRDVLAEIKCRSTFDPNSEGGGGFRRGTIQKSAPITDAAKQWNGWGTALKPSCEDWWLLRKPLAGTVAENLSRFGTGGINIDACRIEAVPGDYDHPGNLTKRPMSALAYSAANQGAMRCTQAEPNALGRWPANITHDGSDEVLAVFPESGSGIERVGSSRMPRAGRPQYGEMSQQHVGVDNYGDSGNSARFFFCSKASRADREEGLDDFEAKQMDESRDEDALGANNPRNRGGEVRKNHHPTVKSTRLMRWLVKLVTRPNGTVLDPFAGSGSTGKACVLERRGFIGIEQDPEFVAIADARIDWARKHLRREQLSMFGEALP